MLLLFQWQESHACYPGPQEPGVIKAKVAVVSHLPFPWHGSDEMAASLLWVLIQIGILSFPEYIIPGQELASGDFYHLCWWEFCNTSWPKIIFWFSNHPRNQKCGTKALCSTHNSNHASYPRPNERGDDYHHFCMLLYQFDCWVHSTWRWLYRFQAGVDAPIVAAAFVPFTLRIRAAAGHLAGSVRQSLGRWGAAVILLVVGTVRMKRVLIILAKKRKETKVWHKVNTKHLISWNRRGIFKVVFKCLLGRIINQSAPSALSSAHWRESYMITLAHCFGNTKPPNYCVELIL